MRNALFYYFNRLLCRNQNAIFSHVSISPNISVDSSSDILAYSIVSRNSVNMYLLAVKSFSAAMTYRPYAVVQSDGSLNSKEKKKIKDHVVGVLILDPDDSRDLVRKFYSPDIFSVFDSSSTNLFIKYQLLTFFALISQYRKGIHFDTDVVFPKTLPSIYSWLCDATSQGFHLPGGNSLCKRVERLSLSSNAIPCNAFNAGFFGVCADSRFRAVIEQSIRLIQSNDPDLLSTWEIAQALIAYVLGETTGSSELGSSFGETIATGWSDWKEIDRASVIHFVGSARFRQLSYIRISRSFCKKLRRALS